MTRRVMVVGATGFTGQLICRHLQAHQLDYTVAGRDEKELKNLFPGHERIVIDVMDESRLEKPLDRCDILINAVGPFNLWGHQLVTAAAERGLTYLDICGEQHFVKHCLDQIDPMARKNHALIINSCAFESMVADLMVAEICDPTVDYEDISTFYHFSNPGSSGGTKFSMKLARYFPAYRLRNRQLEAAAPMSHQREIRINGLRNLYWAAFVPYPEVVFFQREYKLMNGASHYLFADHLSAPLVPDRNRSKADMQKIVARFQRGHRDNPTEAEMDRQRFSLAAIAATPGGKNKQILVQGKNMYHLTAELIARCVMTLAVEPPEDCGVRTPAQVFAHADLLKALPQIAEIQTS